jgi:GNAT superfamily N-acetyltransferase
MSEIIVRPFCPEHIEQMVQLQRICFPSVPSQDLSSAEEFRHIHEVFPSGTFVALDGQRVVGTASGLYVDFDFTHPLHTITDITGLDGYSNHNPHGEYYYGTDICVHPNYRGRGIASMLYAARKELVRQDNKKGIIAGGFLPGYAKYKDTMPAPDYVARVITGRLFDPTLSFQLKQGFVVLGMLPNYMMVRASNGWATLIYWLNLDYVAPEPIPFELPISTKREMVAV